MSFVLSKLAWAVLSPGNFLVLALASGAILQRSPKPTLQNTGKALLTFAVFCFLLIGVFPVGTWALTPLENSFAFAPPPHVDGIIILGGDESGDISLKREQPTAFDSLRRHLRATRLAQQFPDAQIVFAGGSGALSPPPDIKESDIAAVLLAEMGIAAHRVTFESNSRNTYENATMSAALVQAESSKNWLLVTSAWHMPRAMGCFRQAGWNVFAAPAGYFTTGEYPLYPVFRFEEQLRLLTLATHEYIGLAVYKALGRIATLWPD